jgi:uncharacterized membrane protein
MSMVSRGLLRGLAAGAAGTTALNAVSGLDAVVRARPASEAPQQLVAAIADSAGLSVPGNRAERANRIAALGPLAGIATGLGLGAAAGSLRALGLRLPTVVGGPLLGAVAMLATDGPLALAKVSDPRTWTRSDWLADIGPHLAYGVTTHATLVALARDRDGTEPVAPVRVSTLLRAAALGAATGARSSAGVTALAMTSRPQDTPEPVARLGTTTGRIITALLATTEVVLDKQSATPPRTAPQGLLPRLSLGAATAAGLAMRRGDDPDLPALVGALAAGGAAAVGIRWRALAQRRFGSDLPGALIEDATAAALAWLGARRDN